ncbi:MAG: hypothetical protein IPF84_17080 [Proteobacteria bacterium]|nr:hypothetical protein [Pseudomonadota bacterium]
MGQEHAELRPLAEGVVHSLAKAALGQHLGCEGLEPGVEGRHDRRGLLLADRDPLCRRDGTVAVPEQALDQRQLAVNSSAALAWPAFDPAFLASRSNAAVGHTPGVRQLEPAAAPS